MMAVLQGLLNQADDRVTAEERIVVALELAALHAGFDAPGEGGGQAIAQALAVARSADHGLVREGRPHDPGPLLRVVEQALEVGAKPLHESRALTNPPACPLHQLLGRLGRERNERLTPVREVEIERADRHVRLARDVLGTGGLEPPLGEEPARRVEQTLAGLGLPALMPIDLEIGANLDTHGSMIICQS